tara:strand:- start:656 stop:1450 length:795 start_codon:yes stop_codon:yes gene_type:complete
MKIAICFWGITRSLKYTINSIKKRIFEILTLNKIEYDIFMHCYSIKTYNNIRSNEKTSNFDNEEYKLLNPKYLAIDSQEEISEKLNLKDYRTHFDPYYNKYDTVNNIILASYSKSKVVDLIKESKNEYDYVIYLRPDVYYINDFDIGFFDLINNDTICTPNFHCFGNQKRKINDRFAITNFHNYQIYGNIFYDLLEYSKKSQMHSESLLSGHLIKNKIKYEYIDFFFCRIRLNGSTPSADENKFLRKNLDPKCFENNCLKLGTC